MLKLAKLALLAGAARVGLFARLLESGWRRSRLLILGYHGVSLEDEHLWNPGLFLRPEELRRRFSILADLRCTVLPLGEALERLRAGSLPPRSVALTFDDGYYNFYRLALPMLREFGFPATVYLTTYYCCFNRPVFDPACDYLLWKAQARNFFLPELAPELAPGALVAEGASRRATAARIMEYARRRHLSGREKDALLARLAASLGIDYEALCASRILNLMTPEEVRQTAAAGIDIQLHTHRHRVSADRDVFLRQIEDNREVITGITGVRATHFCYPSGYHLPEFGDWLREIGVASAVTTRHGLADPSTPPYFLPRLIDSGRLTETEFTAWVSGFAAWLPHRQIPMDSHQLMTDSQN